MINLKQPDARRLRVDAKESGGFWRQVRAGTRWFGTDRSILAKGLRFGLVGAMSGLIFAVVTAMLISVGGVDEKLSSILGYVLSMPVNFFANRSFSFQSQGRVWADAARFTSLHIVNMAVTASAMEASVNLLGLHYVFGVVSAILLVPLASFVLMNVWVFRKRAHD